MQVKYTVFCGNIDCPSKFCSDEDEVKGRVVTPCQITTDSLVCPVCQANDNVMLLSLRITGPATVKSSRLRVAKRIPAKCQLTMTPHQVELCSPINVYS